MAGLSQAMDIARRSLLAQQAAISVTGNNLANVNTPGYTRQTAILDPSPSELTPQGVLGTGVSMDGIQRTRDVFLDSQVRSEMALAGRWDARSETLTQAESVLNEPTDSGLGDLMDNFWNSWLELSNQPESSSARSVVIQSGQDLAQGLQQIDSQIRAIINSSTADLSQRVDQLDTSLQQVADLNVQITTSEIGGGVDGNLRDQRDLLLDQLAQSAGASSTIRSDGTAVVRIGGRTVVDGDSVVPLELQGSVQGGQTTMNLAFADHLDAPVALSGELGGILEARDQVLPSFLSQMDQLASTIASTVNEVHSAGPTHLNFFTGNTAATLQVNPDIANDPSQLNAGTTGDAGDNDIALAIANLRDARTMDRSTATMGDYYQAVVTNLGSLGQQANTMSQNEDAAVQSLDANRQSAIGVNMDEELTRMVTTEKAYDAAAKVFSTVSDMFDTLLQM